MTIYIYNISYPYSKRTWCSLTFDLKLFYSQSPDPSLPLIPNAVWGQDHAVLAIALGGIKA